jgi:magnesium transporter
MTRNAGVKLSRRPHRRSKPGTAPGTIHVDSAAPRPQLEVMAWGPDGFEEHSAPTIADLQRLRERFAVVWINVDGLGDASTLEELQQLFGLHALAMEDVVNLHQRPKVDVYGDHLYVVMRMFLLAEEPRDEQLSLFLGQGWVLTFQERPGDCLDPVRQRVRQGRPRLRQGGADYLAYAIVDAVVDHLFPVLEHLGDRLEALEERIFLARGNEPALQLQHIKRELVGLRRAVWPLREALGQLLREDTPLVGEGTRVYLRDAYDHAIQLLDLVESDREVASGLEGVLLSVISNRMNEVMKVLTIIGTIFIPLGFVAGLYGMNFDPSVSPWNMPELGWAFGYPFALLLMASIAVGLLLFFRRRGWL